MQFIVAIGVILAIAAAVVVIAFKGLAFLLRWPFWPLVGIGLTAIGWLILRQRGKGR